MDASFLRAEMLLGTAALDRLRACHVLVLGLGGVGSWCAEALARAGVGTLTLADHDQIGQSNLNRQLIALHSTLGQDKAEAMAARVRDINPHCDARALVAQYTPQQADLFFHCAPDYIVDAIDMVSSKLHLIETALTRGIPIISALGTGNKLDASQFCVTDLSKTSGCPLARVLRKELSHRGIVHHKVVFSPELPLKATQAEEPPPGRRSIPGSVSWVPPVAGMLLAGEVVQDLIAE